MRVLSQLVALVSLTATAAFYLPGVAPRDYADGETLSMLVNKLDSVHTQLPYDYYSLPFCQPTVIVKAAENIGEVLGGESIESSGYQVRCSCATIVSVSWFLFYAAIMLAARLIRTCCVCSFAIIDRHES